MTLLPRFCNMNRIRNLSISKYSLHRKILLSINILEMFSQQSVLSVSKKFPSIPSSIDPFVTSNIFKHCGFSAKEDTKRRMLDSFHVQTPTIFLGPSSRAAGPIQPL